jgi:hypothetical protein
MHMPGLKPELGLDCPVHLFAIGFRRLDRHALAFMYLA